jgi:pimeloyl-ACP methyl ester carboxylesterase
VPSTYVVCTHDHAISPSLQRAMAAHAQEVVEWDSDHSPFLTRPTQLAELLASYLSPAPV